MLRILTLAAVCLLTSRLAADRPSYTVARTDSKIVVDGKVEAAWKDAPSFGAFKFPWWKEGKREQTDARMLWDDRYLYVLYQCDDAHISAQYTKRDERVYLDDCVELFTAPNPKTPKVYFNIEMNVNAAILDRYHPPRGKGKELPQWDATGILIKVSIDGTKNDDSDTDKGWVLEVAIPFSDFKIATGKDSPSAGDVWRLNLNRCGGETNAQYSQWSPSGTTRPSFHVPEAFGRIVFSKLSAPALAKRNWKAAGFESQAGFFKLPRGTTLGACSAVDTDRDGNIYLFHRGAKPIICLDSKGNYLRSWGDDLIGKAHGLRIDRHGYVWATDIKHHVVYKFSSTGKLLLALGAPDRAGESDSQFNQPTDVAFGPNDEVFVSDGYGNSRVVKFDHRGKFLTAWGTAGKKPGEFNLPHTIVVDGKDRVIVGDRENDRIQVFDLEGKRLAIWPGFAPYGIELDAQQRIWIADGRAQQILRLDENGKVTQRLGNKGSNSGQFNLPHMLAADKHGNLIIAEVGNKRFQRLLRR